MWRMASLTGIGRIIGREPYFHKDCIFERSLDDFPEYMRRLRQITKEETQDEEITVDFGLCSETYECKCGDEDFKELRSVSEKYLIITGEYLQCYQWLEPIYEEIREIFNWSQQVREESRIMAENVFRSDKNHKLCVHNRRGDFIALGAESKMDFTVAAVEFVYFQIETFGNIYIPEFPGGSILEDQSFGSLECDSLLITASSSTYSWWIGYLMRSAKNPSVGRIYYNSEFHVIYGYENFPPHWIPIKLKDGVIREDFSGLIVTKLTTRLSDTRMCN
ncbi:galactoside 2-alpha-L-fucosyltransferase [Ditylenchus destructor]|uniref:Galactoside 2-alpha-L-fucosyltransferase n=1 Tax=Ditylenchus destructor TaxID=166010 RepID=A0AAD4ML55_9BILA|nr:galactoside 2-alpha-L-fucosyltransferase [Ditylenchus destructor]